MGLETMLQLKMKTTLLATMAVSVIGSASMVQASADTAKMDMAKMSMASGAGNPLVEGVRKANERFKDVAVAKAEGYSPIPCVSGIEGGAMGIHYVNSTYVKDDVIDIAKPEAVMYEPMPDGKLALIAVEYISLKGPAALQGHLFSFTGAPNRYGLPPFYELHVWTWKKNPAGAFADMNPTVSCDAAVPSQ
jgi:hypothetical protein